jgi:hypothetical protein
VELFDGVAADHNAVADGFDSCRVPVSGALQEFVDATYLGKELVEAARRELAALVNRHADEGPGVLVLTGLPADVTADRRVLLRVSELLGSLLPQDREGTMVREVRDRGTSIGESVRARYSDSRFGGNLHTEGVEAPLPAPDFFTLLCIRQSTRGGALQFVHIRDVERALSASPDVVATLRAPFHFDRGGDQLAGEPPTIQKPVLFAQRGRPAITYLRSYVERGHEHPGVPPLTKRQRYALDALDRVVDSGEFTCVGKLREGELALFDNLSLLHGRTEFYDDPEHARLLLRTWIRRHPLDAA